MQLSINLRHREFLRPLALHTIWSKARFRKHRSINEWRITSSKVVVCSAVLVFAGLRKNYSTDFSHYSVERGTWTTQKKLLDLGLIRMTLR